MHFIGIEINHRSVVYIIKENTVAGYFASMFEKAEKTWMKIDKRAFQFTPGCNHKWLVNTKTQKTVFAEFIFGSIPYNTAIAFRYQEY